MLLPPLIKSPRKSTGYILEAYEADRNLKRFGIDFGGDSSIYRRTVAASEFYLEYGGGHSTVWYHRNIAAPGYTLETSLLWAEKLKEKIGASSNVSIKYFDLGQIGEWGRPRSYEKRQRFLHYVCHPWFGLPKAPDVILIDGRFRVACFLAAFSYAQQRTTIVFDDYVHRPKYHVVEEFLSPVQLGSRLAVFVIDPGCRDADLKQRAISELQKFSYVMD